MVLLAVVLEVNVSNVLEADVSDVLEVEFSSVVVSVMDIVESVVVVVSLA